MKYTANALAGLGRSAALVVATGINDEIGSLKTTIENLNEQVAQLKEKYNYDINLPAIDIYKRTEHPEKLMLLEEKVNKQVNELSALGYTLDREREIAEHNKKKHKEELQEQEHRHLANYRAIYYLVASLQQPGMTHQRKTVMVEGVLYAMQRFAKIDPMPTNFADASSDLPF